MPDHPAALLPPEKWRHLRWHWIRFPPFDPVPAYWRHESATWLTLERGGDGNYLASLGFVYVKPCVPAAFVPDPENEAQIECVKTALEQTSVMQMERHMKRKVVGDLDFEVWREHAPAVLTALRDLK